jgi:predicted metal-dependent phosphoesterase TrpH
VNKDLLKLNADLHSHSTLSDGWHDPAEVVARAARNGVELFALTDHDSVGGIDAAMEAARGHGLSFAAGVEISVSLFDQTVHIVGLGIDHRNRKLLDGLVKVREGRGERAERIAAALEAAGVPDALAGARRFVGNPELVSRAHFARHIVAIGLMPDVSTVFQHYLAEGKPGFVSHEWASLEDAVGWIRAAGGVAVIAHPARYRFSAHQFDHFFERFIAAGGEGIEVVSGAHTDAEIREYADIARRLGLLASRGSDFHGENESRVDLGRCEPMPLGLEPVWTRLI